MPESGEKRIFPSLRTEAARRLAVMPFIGFASGLPLVLPRGTLQAWMTVEGVDLQTMGVVTSLVALPYTLKFLWAPLVDRFVPPLLGRRRGWMLLSQIALMLTVAALSFQKPAAAPDAVFVVALLLSFAGATQDIVIDAYRTDILEHRERGLGISIFTIGYRLGMIVAGSASLIIADRIGWRDTYLLLAGVMVVPIITTLLCPKPRNQVRAPASLRDAVVEPLREFLHREGTRVALAILGFILLYRLGDVFASALRSAFLIRGVGFSQTAVGVVDKGVGLAASIGGALLAGLLMTRIDLYRSLLLFGLLQALSNFMFVGLYLTGTNHTMLAATAIVENVCGAMGGVALSTLLQALCDKRFSAFQFALFSSIPAIGLPLVGPSSGYLAEAVGWPLFYVLTAAAAVPGLLALIALRKRISPLD